MQNQKKRQAEEPRTKVKDAIIYYASLNKNQFNHYDALWSYEQWLTLLDLLWSYTV